MANSGPGWQGIDIAWRQMQDDLEDARLRREEDERDDPDDS